MYVLVKSYTSVIAMSRTNIDIDDELMAQAMEATGQTTKKGAVEEALRLALRARRQRLALDRLWGIAKDEGFDEVQGSWTADKDE